MALNNLQRVDMPLNKETKPNQTKKKLVYLNIDKSTQSHKYLYMFDSDFILSRQMTTVIYTGYFRNIDIIS